MVSKGCFINALWALQNNLAKIYNARDHIHGENFKTKLCICGHGFVHTYKIPVWNSRKEHDFTDGYEMIHKDWSSIEEVPYCFYMPVFRQDALWYGAVRPSVHSSVRCGCQLMMVVGIVILYWTTMVVGSRSFNASHRRSTRLLLLRWWAIVVLMLLIEDQVYYCNGRSTVLLENQISLEDQLLCWKIDCFIGR